MASTGPARAFQADPYDYGEVRRLASELELAEPVAVTLVRRGYRTVDAARRFLEARESHEPAEFRGMEEVCELILEVARGGGRITDPRRLRRRRGLLDRDPRLDAPLPRSDMRLADPRPARGRLRADDVERRAAAAPRHGAGDHGGLRNRLRRGGGRGSGGRDPGRGHRPPPPGRAPPRLPGDPPDRLRATPSRVSAPPASRTSSPSPSATPRGRGGRDRGRPPSPLRPRPRHGGAGDSRRHGPPGRREPPPGSRGPAGHA